MMKHVFVFLLILSVVTGCSTPSPPQPTDHQAIEPAVQRVLEGKDDSFQILQQYPIDSSKALIASLHTVPVDKLTAAEQTGHLAATRVVRAIRALRRLTGCNFMAPTAYAFQQTEVDEERKDLLTNHGDLTRPMPFFATRMSTDTVYFAPEDAQ